VTVPNTDHVKTREREANFLLGILELLSNLIEKVREKREGEERGGNSGKEERREGRRGGGCKDGSGREDGGRNGRKEQNGEKTNQNFRNIYKIFRGTKYTARVFPRTSSSQKFPQGSTKFFKTIFLRSLKLVRDFFLES
jgi:hypothetical protein